MTWKHALSFPALAFVLAAPASTVAAAIDLPVLGKVRPRAASEIASSPWSIGGETLDRDFTVYEHYKEHLGPLGAKGIRLQAGWAKRERSPGVYTFEWLDAVIDDAVARGLRPWLEFNYGNPAYPGGGDTGLGGGFPSSPEALAAWDRWMRALVLRYRDHVREWEVWNEPDINNRGTATVEAYLDLYVRTASIVRELQPESRLYALALAHDADYAEAFLSSLKTRGRLDLVDAVTIHGYPRNPDEIPLVGRLRDFIATLGRDIRIRQGETGAPSGYQTHFALRGISWTENTQAKWNLRRMLAHHAADVPFNLFSISDMHYTQGTNTTGEADGVLRMNHKGLLATNPDQTVSHRKLSYFAAQNVFSIFDDTVRRLAEYPFTTTALRAVALTGYEKQGGGQIVAFWFNDAPPGEADGPTLVEITLPKGRFTEPVLVDLRTSTVHVLPAEHRSGGAEGVVFRQTPVYDSPMLIAERAAIPLVPAR